MYYETDEALNNNKKGNKGENKMRKIKTIITAGVAAVALVATQFANVSAADPVVAEYKGGNISSNPGVFRITRKVTNATNSVTNTFSYSIAADSGNPGTATGYPTSASIVMSAAAVSSNTATGTTDISFKTTTFSELGDYYFTVSETASSNATNYPVDTKKYKIVASVRNQLDSSNVPTDKYIVTLAANSIDESNNKAAADGANAFISAANRTYIELTQNTTGSMAKKDDCFKYQIIIPAVASIAPAGDSYKITTNSTCTGSSANAVVGGTNYVVLRHGDTATIGKNGTVSQMPVGLSYTIKLVDEQGYQTTYYDGTASSSRESVTKTTVAQSASNFNSQNKTTIRNDKYADPNTGLAMNLLPFMILVILAGAGVAVVVYKKKTINE